MTWCLAGFLGSMITCTIGAPEGLPYYQLSAWSTVLPMVHIPTAFNGLFRQSAAVSLLRHHIAVIKSTGMLTRCPSTSPFGLRVRSRLTLIRLALIRKPWSFGGQVSRLPYRYLCLHLLFQKVHGNSRIRFAPAGMLPYRSASWRIPQLRWYTLCPFIIHARSLD